jgi:hypothetical protein
VQVTGLVVEDPVEELGRAFGVPGPEASEESTDGAGVEGDGVEALGEDGEDGVVGLGPATFLGLDQHLRGWLDKVLLAPFLHEVAEPVAVDGRWKWLRGQLFDGPAVTSDDEGLDALGHASRVPDLDLGKVLGVVADLDLLLGQGGADLVLGAEKRVMRCTALLSLCGARDYAESVSGA